MAMSCIRNHLKSGWLHGPPKRPGPLKNPGDPYGSVLLLRGYGVAYGFAQEKSVTERGGDEPQPGGPFPAARATPARSHSRTGRCNPEDGAQVHDRPGPELCTQKMP